MTQPEYGTSERARVIRSDAAEKMRRLVDAALVKGEELDAALENAEALIVREDVHFWETEFGLGMAGLDGINDYLTEIAGA